MPGGAGTPGGYQPSQSYSRSYNPGAGGVVTHQPITKSPTITTGDGPSVTRGGPPSILNRPPTIPKGRTTTGGITGSNNWKKFIKNRYTGSFVDRRIQDLKARDPWQTYSQLGRSLLGQPTFMPVDKAKYIKDGMMDVYSGTSDKALKTFNQYRTKGLSNLDDVWKAALGKFNLGGSEGVYFSPHKATAQGYASPFKVTDPSTWGRGSKFAKQGAGKLLSGRVPAHLVDITKNLYGQDQGIMSSKLANKTYFNKAADVIKKVPLPIRKFLTKAIPGVGVGVSAADAAYRASKGDVLGSILSGGSAVPGWGLIPLAAQVGTDWMGLTGPKTYKAQGGIVDLYRYGGF